MRRFSSLSTVLLAAMLLGAAACQASAAALTDLGMKLERTITEYFPHRYSIGFLPDGRLAVTNSGEIAVYDLDKGGVRQFTFKLPDLYKMVVSPVGSYVAATDGGSTVRVWDAMTGELAREINQKTFNFTGIAFTPDGQNLVFCAENPTHWVVLNIPSGELTTSR
ncbi:MAG: hypothetical protein WC943_14805 [Elusimicrobiota bacterium]|jgi:WD40 repeat protein